ncbi:hypothetical protein ACFFP0_31700 [Rhizobium puerariae]|uniref:Uncharacterized protein n=1 Tax=Rhizobium puerariae TaxID=1585791 RepID=A0ABV6AS39_9HYPH
MNIKRYHGNQSSTSPRARKFRDQLTLVTVVAALEDIADDISEGRNVKALHAMRNLSGAVLDDMRGGLADHASLAAYRPMYELDAALHAIRRTLLEKRANAERWRYRWDGDVFSVEDDDAGVYLSVDANDNWVMSVDGTRDNNGADSGLTSLLHALNNNTLAEEVARLSRWLERQEARA